LADTIDDKHRQPWREVLEVALRERNILMLVKAKEEEWHHHVSHLSLTFRRNKNISVPEEHKKKIRGKRIKSSEQKRIVCTADRRLLTGRSCPLYLGWKQSYGPAWD
jgi:hypothetical protein